MKLHFTAIALVHVQVNLLSYFHMVCMALSTHVYSVYMEALECSLNIETRYIHKHHIL